MVNKLAKNAILRKVEGSVKDMVKEKFVGISMYWTEEGKPLKLII